MNARIQALRDVSRAAEHEREVVANQLRAEFRSAEHHDRYCECTFCVLRRDVRVRMRHIGII